MPECTSYTNRKEKNIMIESIINIDDLFKKYTKNILATAESETEYIHIKRKIDHSYRVANLSVRIGKTLNLNEHDISLIKTMSLIHDIGRFTQFIKYKTYDDLLSENHALLSAKIIEKENILSNYNEEEQKLILKAISLHNKKDLPDNLNEKEFIFSTILRDADKIDFFKSMVDIIPNIPTKEQAIFYSNKENKEVISDNVYNLIIQRKTVDNNLLKTVLDKKVRALGFITSDINHKESLKIIYENDYIDKIYKLMPQNIQTNTIYSMTKKYVKDKIN